MYTQLMLHKKTLLAILLSLGLLACNSNSKNSSKNSGDMKSDSNTDNTTHPTIHINSQPWNQESRYQFDLYSNQIIEKNKHINFTLQVLSQGVPVELATIHERKIHLIIVNDALTWFHHIHPVAQPDGTYSISEQFPASGKYWIFADYTPIAAEQTITKIPIIVDGDDTLSYPVFQEKNKAISEDLAVTLLNSSNLQTNRAEFLDVNINQNGSQLRAQDIEPYLGAIAHIIIISKEGKNMLHVHPSTGTNALIHGETFFPAPGLYRMWVQFQINDKLHTVDFTFNVKEGENQQSEKHSTHHH